MPAVTDERDIRTLIPRVRRTIDGPHATSSGAASSNFSDDEITAQIADAIAEVIFFSPDGFGKELIVTEREAVYLAPISWITSEPLTDPEASVIVIQAALNNLYFGLTTMKTSEHIVNEGEEWEWSISSTAVADRVKALQKLRDEAIAQLESEGSGLTEWVNTLEVRDAYTDALIEPWLGGSRGGQVFC